MTDRDEVPCPACAELILAAAKKCRHCGEWLQAHETLMPTNNLQTGNLEEPHTFVIADVSRSSPTASFRLSLPDGTPVGNLCKGDSLSVHLPHGRQLLSFGLESPDPIEVEVPEGGGGETTLFWNGRRWVVDDTLVATDATAIPEFSPALTRGAPPNPGSGMVGLGYLSLVGGVIWMLFAFNMDTSVSVGGESFFGSYVPRSRVANLDLMNQQRNHLMIGGVASLIGVIMLVGGGRRES